MFKSFRTVSHSDSISTFLENLSYWQTINLYITLLQARSDISYSEAKGEAIANWGNPDKLKYLLNESLNSPSPKDKSH